jgi:hypothetical protein
MFVCVCVCVCVVCARARVRLRPHVRAKSLSTSALMGNYAAKNRHDKLCIAQTYVYDNASPFQSTADVQAWRVVGWLIFFLFGPIYAD